MNKSALKKSTVSVVGHLGTIFGLNFWLPVARKYGPPKVRFTKYGVAAAVANLLFLTAWLWFMIFHPQPSIKQLYSTSLTTLGTVLFRSATVLSILSTQIGLWFTLRQRKAAFQQMLLVEYKLAQLNVPRQHDDFLKKVFGVAMAFFAFHSIKAFLLLRSIEFGPGPNTQWIAICGIVVLYSYFNLTFILNLFTVLSDAARTFKAISVKLSKLL